MNDDRETPPELFEPLNARFKFTLDACATSENAKCRKYYTKEQNGLMSSWERERVWFNPPFTEIAEFVRKAWESKATLAVGLVPATRTEQAWWADLVEPYRDGRDTSSNLILTTEFLRKRIHFLEDGHPIWNKDRDGIVKLNEYGLPTRSSPKFGCVLLIWRAR